MKTFFERLNTFHHYWPLLEQLVSRDIKLKYRRSFLGYIWSILNPLLTMLIMVIVFSNMFRFDIQNYPVYLIIGQTIFGFVSESTNHAMWSITGNAALLKKTYVPKYIFTLAQITSSLVELIFSVGALLIVMIATKASFQIEMLLLPFVFLQAYVFCCGLGLFLAQLNVFFRDMQQIYKAVTTAWFYLTPLIYPMERIPELLQFFIRTLNPAYYYVTQSRCLVLYGQLPSLRVVTGGCIWAVVMLIIGVYSFQRSKDRFILYI